MARIDGYMKVERMAWITGLIGTLLICYVMCMYMDGELSREYPVLTSNSNC